MLQARGRTLQHLATNHGAQIRSQNDCEDISVFPSRGRHDWKHSMWCNSSVEKRALSRGNKPRIEHIYAIFHFPTVISAYSPRDATTTIPSGRGFRKLCDDKRKF
ncbi:hypothetical protein ElyMa_004020500 [Elysia marginata]|uniref:Uncharacterized protein n=1 Tax=Elysia marginata TaxID=1093978 RepID=A0AAV4G450_9GAST|nr:hypothetical protein ElyMa_004020500 [Elysia marginata]